MTETTAVAVNPEPTGLQITPRTIAMLADSPLVPDVYRGNAGSVALCLDMAQRMGLPVLTVLQNLHVIKGKPSWSASFLIGAVNASGRFGPLRFREVGDEGKDSWGFRAEASDLADGELLKGEAVTMAMAKAEGWATRKGSKYRTMPGQMLRYRAAAFWARLYAPEIAHGLLTAEEAQTLPDPGGTRAADLSRAITGEVADTETGDLREPGVDEPAAEVVNGEDDVTRINRTMMEYRTGEAASDDWLALQAEADDLGLTFDDKAGVYVAP